MNRYMIALKVRGKTGREFGLPLEIEAGSRFEAETRALETARNEGFESISVDFIDIIEGMDTSTIYTDGMGTE